MSISFSSTRLRLARCAKGLKQFELADLVGSSKTYISELERGLKEPGTLLVAALAEVLGYSESFFYPDGVAIVFPRSIVNFRHRASTTEHLKEKITAKANIVAMLAEFLDVQLGFPKYDVPSLDLENTNDVVEAARFCREYWGLGKGAPIDSMVRLAENAGVPTVEFRDADRVDAFSAAYGHRALIFLNVERPSASRRRWTIAHEIGHLVVHRGVVTGDKPTESQADAFAAEFLLPAESFSREFRAMHRHDWAHLLELKRRWNVSLAAIIRRGFDLRLLSAASYRRLYKSLSARGWRKEEPQEPNLELPELIPIALSAFQEQLGLSLLDIGHAIGVERENLAEITGFQIPSVKRPDNVTSLAKFKAERAGTLEN